MKFDPKNFWGESEKIIQQAKKTASGGGRGGFGGLKVLGLGAALIGIGFGFISSLYKVEGGHRSIKFNRITGLGETIYDEGTKIAIPVLERAIIYDIRTRPDSISSLTGSKDLQMVKLTVRVLHRPDEKQLPNIYRELGMDYAERVLPSIGNEVLKSVVAQFTAEELLTKRKEVSSSVTDRLRVRAQDFGIIIDDVSITELGFGDEYTHAVEQKQVAQQEAERGKFIVQKALREKEAVIIRAQGEAIAAELLGKAMQENRGFLDIKKIETAQEIAKIIANSKNKVLLPSDGLLLSMTDVLAETPVKNLKN